ncbi:ATP-binding protein [Pelagicoccus sp. SDUM812002]|uniref:ATP-binding response regulator n=1 Tax=Pelagicoccus sp. SDUM812002 TaxID=3041266 RepID=UPI00280C7543|nr:ATP-binding protein [Pelagicoccus sp. SDUM812002]MDQ8187620.1 ATP-binding protein [Pelagicoccus sp. SDUM812002]
MKSVQPPNSEIVRLLVVEEDADNRDLIVQLLAGEREEFSLDWAMSSRELYEKIDTARYDAVLLNFFSGNGTAQKVLRQLEGKHGSLAVVVLAGANVTWEDEKALGSSIDFLLRRIELSSESLERAVRYAIRNRDQQERLRTFSSQLSHDLLGPAGNVRNALIMFKEELGELGRQPEELLGLVESDLERILSILHGLREFSVSQGGEMALRSMSLSDVIEMAIGGLREDVRGVGQCIYEKDLPEVVVDERLFPLLLGNLIENGLKYNISDDPKVELKVEETQGSVIIRVEDNGIGIDADKAADIFQPMVRLQRRSDFEGTGLGLTISREIAARHGGSLSLESSGGTAGGSVFKVGLPKLKLPEGPLD